MNAYGPIQRWFAILMLCASALISSEPSLHASQPVLALDLDVMVLYTMQQNGQGSAALQQIILAAVQIGNWAPAPGDEPVFDPYLVRYARGSVLDYDELPDCASFRISADEVACIEHFRALEHQVRFGPSLFVTQSCDGSITVRSVFDDMLATYIEEVGHSWQEYQYETLGIDSGVRIRLTSQADSERWAVGREYQVKRYILSLDGILLVFSTQERAALRCHICWGYANPLEHEIPAYGAPPGWPNPQGWPVTLPTAGELQLFCGSVSVVGCYGLRSAIDPFHATGARCDGWPALVSR